ncbi:MAG TPA: AMP-binding protein [Cyclobacteriaceae bacterium]|nr:AMP-binding protein [Cyclobacteriaceae bacterium]
MTSSTPWLSLYPDYLPTEAPAFEQNSLPELWDENVRQFAHLTAVENMGKKLTFLELDTLSNCFAAFLQNECGLKPGDRFAIQLPNTLQFPVAILAALKAGLILVNTNPLYTSREMEYQFKDSGATAVLILANFAHNLEKIIDKTSIKTVIVTELGDLLGGAKKLLVNFVVKRVKKLVPPFSIRGYVTFADAVAKGKKAALVRPKILRQDLAFLQYTGGTTGISKGAQLSHENILSNVYQTKLLLENSSRGKMQEGDVAVIPLPLYHIYALTATFIYLNQGMTCRMITNPKDLNAFIKALKKPFHTMIGVNTLFNALLNHPSFHEINLSVVKGFTAGGMALQETVFKRWKEKTGTTVAEGYGLSETSPVLTFQIAGRERMGYIGIPIPGTDIRIMDDDGNELPHGTSGELCARGPQVFSGYWQKDNSNVFHEGGWFKTGDIAVMEEDGYIKIVDRKKDMIIVSGFKVFPNEVEGVIASHPKVLEVAAIGVNDDRCGEVVKVYVVKRDSSLTEEELQIFCKENLTQYKQPKFIEFKTDLPKTNVGKILRRSLREEVVTS